MFLPCKKTWTSSLLKMAASDPNQNGNQTVPKRLRHLSTNKGRKFGEESTVGCINQLSCLVYILLMVILVFILL
jgi:hypothetical protein